MLTDPRNEVPPGGRCPVGTGTMERDEAAVADATRSGENRRLSWLSPSSCLQSSISASLWLNLPRIQTADPRTHSPMTSTGEGT